ncbi:reverse transcriptase [Penicillium riverlandense]|uniref:reverse transcriptase n=1 Tax=Penicillium riverlandense TaxID=1903569 RepID=UPI002547FDF5|nr:reverse transcriptase [Penicillium riverlandense]KAJ5820628.1 reverse transcriptase [Penicillium riverlandense]
MNTLLQLFNACVRLGYSPTHFRKSITVVLRKGGERDFQLAKSYRPVAPLNTLGKFLESAVEQEGLLPPTHLGGRKGISTDHAIHNMIDRIKMEWGKGKPVVSLLMLDVSGAYDNVSHERVGWWNQRTLWTRIQIQIYGRPNHNNKNNSNRPHNRSARRGGLSQVRQAIFYDSSEPQAPIL